MPEHSKPPHDIITTQAMSFCNIFQTQFTAEARKGAYFQLIRTPAQDQRQAAVLAIVSKDAVFPADLSPMVLTAMWGCGDKTGKTSRIVRYRNHLRKPGYDTACSFIQQPLLCFSRPFLLSLQSGNLFFPSAPAHVKLFPPSCFRPQAY